MQPTLDWMTWHYLKMLRRAWKFRRLFRRAVHTDFCPFCDSGEWQATGTAGRLACSCGSIALDGRQKEAVKIGGNNEGSE